MEERVNLRVTLNRRSFLEALTMKVEPKSFKDFKIDIRYLLDQVNEFNEDHEITWTEQESADFLDRSATVIQNLLYDRVMEIISELMRAEMPTDEVL